MPHTEDEIKCNKCRGQFGSCDGPAYIGGMCSCSCHDYANSLYKYESGRIVVRSTGKPL